jgi:16S rRNA (cytidine1402-2'-O)-methyltransferase
MTERVPSAAGPTEPESLKRSSPQGGPQSVKPPGQLWLVPTPITHPDDAPRVLPVASLELIRTLDYFIVEQAKTARAFLKSAGVEKPLQQLDIREFNEHTPAQAIDGLLAPIRAGRDAALISEAGCPAVADPGASLIAAARHLGIRIRPMVGPSAIMLALMASGLEGQRFSFSGYLPQASQDRAVALRKLESRSSRERETVLFIETPYRNQVLLAGACEALAADTQLLVATDVGGAQETIDCKTIARWRASECVLPKLPTVFGILAAQRDHAPHDRSAQRRKLKHS